jgi:CheY-like chemotaxis protein
MTLRNAVQAELPYLRRYARMLMGAQSAGDAAVRETLEAIVEAPEEFDPDRDPRVELYRIFHRIWGASVLKPLDIPEGVIASLPLIGRQALLLTTVESFSAAEAAVILDIAEADVRSHVAAARESVHSMLSALILIIEDEPIIAMHLKSIMTSLGHEVAATVRTRDEAVRKAAEISPELILADISLADGSSGIDAVRDISEHLVVPVIYITAFPDRLLTGERAEPTYLITKPFEPEMVAATVWQALLVHREQAAFDTTGISATS